MSRRKPRIRMVGFKVEEELAALLDQNGFDPALHEQIRSDLKSARIGLAQNRLPANTTIRDVEAGDVFDATEAVPGKFYEIGKKALANGSEHRVGAMRSRTHLRLGARWSHG